MKGNPEAEVTLVEYGDMQCPACASFLPVVQDVMDSYGDSIRFEYRHFPLPIHQHAVAAAMAAEAAGQQGAFFPYHDLLYENQAEWSAAAAPQALFIGYAEELELDIETFRRHMNASLLKDHIQSQFDEGRQRGVTGTPTFFLNGEQMQFETYQQFVEQVANAVTGETATATTETTEASSDIRFGL